MSGTTVLESFKSHYPLRDIVTDKFRFKAFVNYNFFLLCCPCQWCCGKGLNIYRLLNRVCQSLPISVVNSVVQPIFYYWIPCEHKFLVQYMFRWANKKLCAKRTDFLSNTNIRKIRYSLPCICKFCKRSAQPNLSCTRTIWEFL